MTLEVGSTGLGPNLRDAKKRIFIRGSEMTPEVLACTAGQMLVPVR